MKAVISDIKEVHEFDAGTFVRIDYVDRVTGEFGFHKIKDVSEMGGIIIHPKDGPEFRLIEALTEFERRRGVSSKS